MIIMVDSLLLKFGLLSMINNQEAKLMSRSHCKSLYHRKYKSFSQLICIGDQCVEMMGCGS